MGRSDLFLTSTFGGWGDLCFGIADVKCQHTITDEYAADQNGQLNVTATFDTEATPQDAQYTFNHLGQRISKTVAGVKTYFVYSDIDGQMLGEYTATGAPIREYIYLEGERVAMYDYTTVEPKDSTNNKAIVYLQNDHIGQVNFGLNSDGQLIYERVQTPFGETMSEMNAYNVQVPVRFPVQYYDSESGFSQNWHRDYDSSIGRYVQSDPIGLRGGINTFGYVMQNPVMWVDPDGRNPFLIIGGALIIAEVLISTRIAGEVENQSRNQGVDDTKDANRHAEWSRQMAIEQGAAIARAAGDAHEATGRSSGSNSPNQSDMDRHNNQEGRDPAREGRDINSDNLIHFPGGNPGELPGGGTPASPSDEVMRRFCLDNPGAPNCKNPCP